MKPTHAVFYAILSNTQTCKKWDMDMHLLVWSDIFFGFFEVPNFSSVFVTGINTNNLYLKVYSDALFSFYHHHDAFHINSFIKFINYDEIQTNI